MGKKINQSELYELVCVFSPLGAIGGPEGINYSIKSQIIIIIIIKNKAQNKIGPHVRHVSLHLTASPS